MTTTWTDSPVLSAASINELRTAVDAVGGTPATGWTDGTPLSSTATLQPGYFTELRDAIQTLWNEDDRKLGLIPNWTEESVILWQEEAPWAKAGFVKILIKGKMGKDGAWLADEPYYVP